MDIKKYRAKHFLQSKVGEEPSLADKLASYLEDPDLARKVRDKEDKLKESLNKDQLYVLRNYILILKNVKIDTELGIVEKIKLKAKLHKVNKELISTFTSRQRLLHADYIKSVKDLINDRKAFTMSKPKLLMNYILLK